MTKRVICNFRKARRLPVGQLVLGNIDMNKDAVEKAYVAGFESRTAQLMKTAQVAGNSSFTVPGPLPKDIPGYKAWAREAKSNAKYRRPNMLLNPLTNYYQRQSENWRIARGLQPLTFYPKGGSGPHFTNTPEFSNALRNGTPRQIGAIRRAVGNALPPIRDYYNGDATMRTIPGWLKKEFE